MIRTTTSALLGLILLSAIDTTFAEQTTKSLTIVAFGDSTTAVRPTVKQVYADRLPQLLAARGIKAKVINAGVGGSHTGRLTDNSRHKRRHALDRFDDAVRSHKPDIVVIQFGWNDSWVDSDNPDDPSRIPVDKYSANLTHIVTTLTNDGARVILMTPNRPDASVENWRVKRTQQYVDAVRNLAKLKSVSLVDVWHQYERIESAENQSAGNLLLDNVHPNDEGHELVATLLSQEIAKTANIDVTSASKSDLPNIVLIVADDLGYSDLGCYGSEIRTPTLDALAKNGLRFSQFYNAARCCPSRACLLTGLYPHQVGVGHMTYDAGEPGYRGELRTDVPTIADVLKKAGYITAMSGKWHVTHNIKPDSPQNNWPRQRGFDKFFGTLPGHGSLWDPKGLMQSNEHIKAGDDFFYTDAIADHAIKCLQTRTANPLFLYVAFTAPHYPLHARQNTIASYDDIYEAGWDQIRRRRFQSLVACGLLSKHAKLAPRDPASIPWDDEPNKSWQALRMQVFAAMVTEMDAAIGRLVTALKADGSLDNTLLVFVSDNGGSNEGHLRNTIERMKKPWKSSMIPEKTRSGKPVRAGDWPNEPLGGPDTYGSYGPRWANVSNTPFRRHKSWVHEGGISTPCIVHWPQVIRKPGVIRTVGHLVDLMPTFADAAQMKVPTTEGKSLLPVFEGTDVGAREFGWEHEGNRAYRKGKWKIVSEFPGTWTTMYPYEKNGRWELYDLENDRTETHDLAAARPELLKELVTNYEAWAKRIGVVRWDKLEGKQE